MKRYKGYYIDGVIFSTKKDIDNFIKSEIIRKICVFHKMLFDMPGRYTDNEKIAICGEIHDREIRLHDEYGMTWEEIEKIEISTLQ